MKLRKLNVRGMRLLRDFELKCVDANGDPRQWTILVGRNGAGKSTILQAIALAASGQSTANSLADSDIASFPDRRAETAPLEIEGTFDLPPLGPELGLRPHPQRLASQPGARQPARLVSHLELPPNETFFSGTERWSDAHGDAIEGLSLDGFRSRSAPWLFTAGFGTQRFLTTETRRASRPHQQRLESLFSSRSGPLIGLGFADRQGYPAGLVKRFLKLLRSALVGSASTGVGITPLLRNIELRGAGGVSSRDMAEKDKFELALPGTDSLKVPATYLSHGYQSTTAWVADLIGQFLLDFEGDEARMRTIDTRAFTGLVLIDELDLFLHPDWQVGFIEALSATFPNLQFIATTHSPLLVARRRPEEVVLLDWDAGGNIIARPFDGDPRLMNTSELYRRLFGLHDTPPTPLAQDVAQYNFMAGDPNRDDEEEAEVQRLRRTLDEAGVTGLEPLVPRAGV